MGKNFKFGTLALAGIFLLAACTPTAQVMEPVDSSQVIEQSQENTSTKEGGKADVISSSLSYPVVDTNQDDCFDDGSARGSTGRYGFGCPRCPE